MWKGEMKNKNRNLPTYLHFLRKNTLRSEQENPSHVEILVGLLFIIRKIPNDWDHSLLIPRKYQKSSGMFFLL